MQGTEGALGGPDVRRRIPIKLLPKQARSKGIHISLAHRDIETFELKHMLQLYTQCNSDYVQCCVEQ